MADKKQKVPDELIKELDINEQVDIKKDFEIIPRIEPHQIKLPIPRQLIRDLELENRWKNKKKIKLIFDEESKELRYKI
jgi:hypothetical protein